MSARRMGGTALKEVRLGQLSDYLDELSGTEMETGRWGFRGVSSASYDLIPSIGRKSTRDPYDQDLERSIFTKFRQAAVPFVNNTPDSLCAWLALARHHGLPTRLLDWSFSPLVAAFFATIEPSPSDDGFAIYAYETNFYQSDHVLPHAPLELGIETKEVFIDHYSDRMAAQRGFFTIHGQPDLPFRHPTLIKYVFPENMRDEALNRLDFYGINRASLFPGLDGLGAYWAWFYKIST